ncbi:MAG: efflux RND transporter permease subunit [Candidatus Marinimicrobia bacterium]|nr:efflux RND transporter permease subunit [Candidatus Neomarinimicrobiota bacterium]MCF7923345.1 efflux RND transporter permease subunit [Candidatus Neomarinimicrobiota bacterium]
MKRVIEFFARYPIWSNVLLFGVLLFGGIALSNLRYSTFPEIEPSQISIQVLYPGASPEEVEEGVILKIEENLDGLDGIDRVTSTSSENVGFVNVETISGADMDKVLTEVKNAVDRISSFPLGAEKPVVFQQKFRSRALSIVLYGETDLRTMKVYAEELRDRLIATPTISQVTIQGYPGVEISIEVSEADLRRYKLSFDEISRRVQSENVNLSGGKFETRDEEILIRAYGRQYTAADLENLVLRGDSDGNLIYLKDVATVRERWADTPDKTYYNNQTAVVLNIDKTKEENVLDVAALAKQMVAEFNEENTVITAMVLNDNTISLRQRIDLLISNGFFGLILVVLSLSFFLNLRISFWVAIGIPFSFAGMFLVLSFAGITLNVISLFGMIIVIGILVDDAIVVSESIFSEFERGKKGVRAAIDGTIIMVGPVTTSVMTTILVFLPFFFLDGFLGRFIWNLAAVVVAALIFSLIESFLILPAHLAHSKGLHAHTKDSAGRKLIERIIHFITHRMYAPSLKFAMNHKWITVSAPIATVLITVGLFSGGFIGFTFFPFIDGDTLPVNVSLVAGRQDADVERILRKIETVVWEVNTEMSAEREDGEPLILGIKRDIGSNDFGDNGSHTGKLTLQLLDGEQRGMDSYLIANRLRDAIGAVPEAQKISFGRASFFGKPVQVSLLGSNIDELRKASVLLTAELEQFSTLQDVSLGSKEGRREIDIKLKPRAYSLGLTLRDVAGQVRQGFFGQEVQRIQRGQDEVRVWVRYSPEDRSSLGFLDRMRIRTADGSEYPFGELAEYTLKRGITSISHLDKKRELTVEADLSDASLDLPPILAEIREVVVPRVLAQVQGVSVSYEGQSRDQAKTGASFQRTFPLAFAGMFILLILVFRSYIQAILIFGLIPFGVIGAFWGHGIQGLQVNTLSVYGILALTGIIVNDSIVLVDKINRNLKSGMLLYDAVYDAGVSRLRPILLTTFTTAFGLAPLIFETSRQAQFLIPMAVSLAYGLLFGTFLILVVLPASYMVTNKVRVMWMKLYHGVDVTPEEIEPAVMEMQISGLGIQGESKAV